MKMLLIFCSLFSYSLFAQELSVEPYIKMQDALASDNFQEALKAHKNICQNELGKMKTDYKDCGKKFKDIDDLRESFKTLSKVYMEKGHKDEMKNFEKASCPMARASWIQKKGPLRNPYYGKSMLECGEKI